MKLLLVTLSIVGALASMGCDKNDRRDYSPFAHGPFPQGVHFQDLYAAQYLQPFAGTNQCSVYTDGHFVPAQINGQLVCVGRSWFNTHYGNQFGLYQNLYGPGIYPGFNTCNFNLNCNNDSALYYGGALAALGLGLILTH